MFAYEIRDEKRRKLLETCYHEAGHAVMAFLLRLDVAEICVSAQGTHLGTTTAEIPDGPTFKAANSLSGYVAESWAWGLKSGIDAVARKLFFRLLQLQEGGAKWNFNLDEDCAIAAKRAETPRKAVRELFVELVVEASVAQEMLSRHLYELSDLADRLYRLKNGVMSGETFEGITVNWEKRSVQFERLYDYAVAVALDFDRTMLSAKPLPPPPKRMRPKPVSHP